MSYTERRPDSGHTQTFGALLKAHRLRAALSQAELAERAGLGERAIQRLEADRNRPYRATLEQIMDALNLTAAQRDALVAAVPPRAQEPAQPVPPRNSSTTGPRLSLVRPDAAPGDVDSIGRSQPTSQGAVDLRSPSAPGSRPIRTPRGRLIGRGSDARMIRDLLLRPDVGLVTLTGPGGSGKTRLALQVAADLAEEFEDGATFVNLALVADPAAVPTAIVQALDLVELGDHAPTDRLIGHLQARHALLLLDNFEHVLAARDVVAALVDACSRLSVLVTSRAILHVYGEREVVVPPLGHPPDDGARPLDVTAAFPAVELFVERAQAVRPDFALTADNVGAVVAICRQLDGLPLAIELAAARCRLLSPRAILGRLERRLALLTDGPLDLPARQQTLRGAIGWSYDLLEDEERRLFRRLGVFVGGFDLGAGSWVPGAGGGRAVPTPSTQNPEPNTLDLVGSLLDKSLLISLPEVDGEPRFGMLETIREYAVEQLEACGEAAELRQRHAEYFLALAEQADPHLISGEQVAWLARLDAEHANIRAALTWLSIRDDQKSTRGALHLAGALHWYWWLGGAVAEGRGWLRATLERVRPDDTCVVAAKGRALYAAGGLAMIQGDYRMAADQFDAAGALYRQLGDQQGHGRAMAYRAILDVIAGDDQTAWARLIASLQMLREIGDRWGQALAGSVLGAVARNLGDVHEADRLLAEYVGLARETGDRYLLGSALPKWAWVAHERGDLDRAEQLGREALGLFRSLNDGWWTARCLNLLSLMAVERGAHQRAARLLGGAEHVLQLAGAQFIPPDAARNQRVATTLHAQMGDIAFEAARAEGRSAPLDQLTRYAIDTTSEHLSAAPSDPPRR